MAYHLTALPYSPPPPIHSLSLLFLLPPFPFITQEQLGNERREKIKPRQLNPIIMENTLPCPISLQILKNLTYQLRPANFKIRIKLLFAFSSQTHLEISRINQKLVKKSEVFRLKKLIHHNRLHKKKNRKKKQSHFYSQKKLKESNN